MNGSPLVIPHRSAILPTDADDPLRLYYYPVSGYFYKERLRMALRLLAGRHYRRVLDVGYGSGVFLPSLARLGDELHGLDLHEKIPQVEAMLAAHGLRAELISGSALAMPYPDGYFDAVVSISLLEHLPEPGKAIDEMLRVLGPGGSLVVGFPVRNPHLNAFFRLLGYRAEEIHPSSHTRILAELLARCPEIEFRTLPCWLPLNLALYCCCGAQTGET